MDAPNDLTKRRVKRLKLVGIIILVLGLAVAGLVYWIGSRPQDLSDDPQMLGNEKAEKQQEEIVLGQYGVVIDALKQPGTQAVIIIAVSALAGSTCLYFAHLLAHRDDPAP